MRLRTDPFSWLIDDNIDTTTSDTDCAYDRIVVTNQVAKQVVANTENIFNFSTSFNLSKESAQEVSNHYPVEFKFLNK